MIDDHFRMILSDFENRALSTLVLAEPFAFSLWLLWHLRASRSQEGCDSHFGF